jgi:CheY-like chemotaxis protein
MNILLVEDDLKSAQLFTRILETEGYKVTHTASALEGIKLAKQHNFAAVLLDINLPDLDGSVAGLSIHRAIPKLPIIALTAKADSVTRAKTKSFGFSAFIAKPCTDSDLINTLHIFTGASQDA